jgi:hypothetical protein
MQAKFNDYYWPKTDVEVSKNKVQLLNLFRQCNINEIGNKFKSQAMNSIKPKISKSRHDLWLSKYNCN